MAVFFCPKGTPAYGWFLGYNADFFGDKLSEIFGSEHKFSLRRYISYYYLFGDNAHQPGKGTLQFADTCIKTKRSDYERPDIGIKFNYTRLQSRISQDIGQQVIPGDMHFFIVRIADHADNFQTVKQCGTYTTQIICSTNKYNPRQVHRIVDVVIPDR